MKSNGYNLPVRPGISTPLAPVTLVTTPWAETEAARQATATEVEERILMFGGGSSDCVKQVKVCCGF